MLSPRLVTKRVAAEKKKAEKVAATAQTRAKAGKHGAGGGAGGAGRHGASALLLAVLVLVAAMVAGVAWEEAVATPLEEGGVGGVAGQSVVTRVLFRLLDPQWLRLPLVGVA